MPGYNDNHAVYGSQKITVVPPTGVTGTGGTFVAKNIKVDAYDADKKTSMDEMGNEDKQWFNTKIPQGTMTLQLPNATTPPPAQFSIAPLIPVGGGSAVNWLIYKCGETYDAGGETLLDVTMSKQMQSGA